MKKKLKIVVVIMMFLLCTGCGNQLKDGKELVTNKATGQTLQSNILCKPEDKELLETYKKYDKKLQVSIDKLPTCKSFTPNKIEYHSLWETLFIKPLAWLILKLGYLVKNMGISVVIIGLLIRLIMFPLQIKTVKQTENMKKMQPEIDKIERKYRNRTDNDSLMMKSQETMMLYKQYNINPVSSCLGAFIQLPLFFAFLEAVNRVPAIFEGYIFKGTALQMNLGMTPTTGIASHNYVYIILVVLIMITTYLSFKNTMKNQNQTPEMAQQTKFMSMTMIVVITFASLSLPTAIALYWVVTNGFAVIQNYLIKKIIEKRI